MGSGHTGNRSDQEHGSVRTRHHSDVSRSSRRDSNTRRNTIPLQHADPGEHSPALTIRHRPARSRSHSYDSVSSRRRSRSTSRLRGKKKSHKKRKPSTSSSSSSCRSSSSSSSESERERKRHKSKKKKKKHSKHSKSHSKRDKSKKKHKRSPTPSPSPLSSSVSSDSSSSSPRRSPAKKKPRLASRSPSPAGVNPQSVHRAESPASHRDHLSLYADSDDELYSHSEDAQDSAPDNTNPVPENQSEISQEDFGFSGLIDEVFKLLPSDMFPRKTEEFLGGNRPRSSIELEVGKATRKNCSLPQSRRPLMQAVQCINESLGASAVDGTFPMPSSITQDWLPSRADIKKLVKVKFYQSHNEFIPTENASALDPDATRLGLSLNGSYPVKVSAIKDLETLSRDTIKILSHAEIFSFAAYKALQSESMDSKTLFEILKSMSRAVTDAMSIVTAQALGLQQLRREAAIDSAPKGFLTDEAKRKLRLSSFTSKLLFDGQVASICKENTDENQQLLIINAVSNQGKPVPSFSTRKSKSKPGKKKPISQETPKKDFTFPVPRAPKKGQSSRGSSSRVEVVAPPIEEPPPARKTEVHTPLPLPLPNIPVGGRLAHFAQDWAKITDDKWVLFVIRDGYRVPFLERPILSPNPVFFQQPLSQHLEEEVASLLSKGAVEEIIPECPGHYSRIFLVPKKNGKLRLIIDLSVLNHFVYTQTFKMETQRKVKDAVQLNDWAFSLDLTDAYLHIPIHYRSRKFLRFTLRGRVYQFKALPFGLSTSPFVFTRLMEVIATFVRRRAITIHPYLDDWLARNQNRRRLLEHRQFILSLINSLGLIINYEKSDLVPAQVFTFIGMEFLTHTNIVRVPQSRQMKILKTVRMFSQKTSVSARDFLSLLGQLNAAADLVMLGRLHLRPLQVSLRNQCRPQNLPYSHQVRGGALA